MKNLKKLLLAALMISAITLIGCEKNENSTVQDKQTENSISMDNTKIKENSASVDLKGKTIIACVGDSITFGAGVSDIDKDTYPLILQNLLGDDYAVLNYGSIGSAAQNESEKPYQKQQEYQESLNIKAQKYIIMLGTNDSTDANWKEESYRNDLSKLIDNYKEVAPESQIYLMTPPMAYVIEGQDEVLYSVNPDVIGNEIYSIVAEVAAEKNATLLDIYELTSGHPEWFNDGVHPNEAGNKAIAEYIYANIV